VASSTENQVHERKLPQVPVEKTAVSTIGLRRTPHEVTDEQGKRQLAKFQDLNIGRFLAAGESVVFSVGAMNDVILEHDGKPPASAVRNALHKSVLRTMTASPTGHMWMASKSAAGKVTLAPFDAAQCAAAMQSPWSAKHVQDMIDSQVITESQMRSLYGQATAGAAVRLLMEDTEKRLATHWRRDTPPTVLALGAGLNLTALQICEWMGDGEISDFAEGCPIAGPAGLQLTRQMGHNPTVWEKAHDPALAHKRHMGAVDLITGRCAPFSKAGNGAEREAAFNELRYMLESATARRSRIIIWETADGAWENADTRRRIETMLLRCSVYEWEGIIISPHIHCGIGIMRKRVFYVGVMCGRTRPRQEEEEEEEEKGEVKPEVEEPREASPTGGSRQSLVPLAWTLSGPPPEVLEEWRVEGVEEQKEALRAAAGMAAREACGSSRPVRRRSTVTSGYMQAAAAERCARRRELIQRMVTNGAAAKYFTATLPTMERQTRSQEVESGEPVLVSSAASRRFPFLMQDLGPGHPLRQAEELRRTSGARAKATALPSELSNMAKPAWAAQTELSTWMEDGREVEGLVWRRKSEKAAGLGGVVRRTPIRDTGMRCICGQLMCTCGMAVPEALSDAEDCDGLAAERAEEREQEARRKRTTGLMRSENKRRRK